MFTTISKFPIVPVFLLLGAINLCSCTRGRMAEGEYSSSDSIIRPVITTEPTLNDTDDPAIWINRKDRAASLILGTDKGNDNGGIYVYHLDGKLDTARTVLELKRPNNIDVEYGLRYLDSTVDIAVFTERNTNQLRVFRLPEMKPIDGGGIPAFEGESDRAPMGIALYKEPSTGNIYAIVSRKIGPDGSYLWEYLLSADDHGVVIGKKVRAFGKFNGGKEIEAIAVDDALGYVYYSDERFGVHQYYASPDSSNTELSEFGTSGFAGDQEGISIYPATDSTGYIIVSDQQANKFQIFSREGRDGKPYFHKLLKVVSVLAHQSDGSDVTNIALDSTFANGLFVAMSDNRTFQYYRWEDIAGKDLQVSPATLKE